MATPPKGSVKSSTTNKSSANYSSSVRPSSSPAAQVVGPKVVPLANNYPAGGTPIGNSAANKPVLDAWRASGGTTTSTYVDKYTNPTNPGETALQEAQRLQQQGAAAIFQRVQEKDNPGQAKPTVYTRTLADGQTKQNVLTGEILPPEKKILISPAIQAQSTTDNEYAAISRPYNVPSVTLNTNSLANNLPPAKGGNAGAMSLNAGEVAALSYAQNVMGAVGQTSAARAIKGLISILGPGVQMRLSAKRGR